MIKIAAKTADDNDLDQVANESQLGRCSNSRIDRRGRIGIYFNMQFSHVNNS